MTKNLTQLLKKICLWMDGGRYEMLNYMFYDYFGGKLFMVNDSFYS